MAWYVEWRHPGKTGWLRTDAKAYATRGEAQQEVDYQRARPELQGRFGMVEYQVVQETEPSDD
jgi:hypothetical protein